MKELFVPWDAMEKCCFAIQIYNAHEGATWFLLLEGGVCCTFT